MIRFVPELCDRELGLPKNFTFPERVVASPHLIHSMGFAGDYSGHEGCVNALSFDPSGTLLVSGSDDATVKVWSHASRKCICTLQGHVTNVFATSFFPHRVDADGFDLLSGGNDSTLHHYQVRNDLAFATVYHDHSKKILRTSINPLEPDLFLSASADGTVRMFDIRCQYPDATTLKLTPKHGTTLYEAAGLTDDDAIVPQALGGGLTSSFRAATRMPSARTLCLDFNQDPTAPPPTSVPVTQPSAPGETRTREPEQDRPGTRQRVGLFSVEFNPLDGNTFIVSAADGNVRLFDLRKIDGANPYRSCLNVYRNINTMDPAACEMTGCSWSSDGQKIVSSALADAIYIFDVHRNFAQELHLDYNDSPAKRRHARFLESIARVPLPPRAEHRDMTLPQIQAVATARYLASHNFLAPSPSDQANPTVEAADSDRSSHENSPDLGASDTSEDTSDAQHNDERPGEEGQEDSDRERRRVRRRRGPRIGEHRPDAVVRMGHQTYERRLEGHVSIQTIKGVTFYGPGSEYVMSGSDDGLTLPLPLVWSEGKKTRRFFTASPVRITTARIYIWETSTGRLVRVLEGHESVVNVLVWNQDGDIVSSGIDNEAKCWQSGQADVPVGEAMTRRLRDVEELAAENRVHMEEATEAMGQENRLLEEIPRGEFHIIDPNQCAVQ
ncbi:putative WD and tetratricopeptide repeats protein 1 [Paratrimastix pyriformis]|uniref:WD and tetratricopeptide repeats protein 1 n=1 Tax=Paratrimastix pyriformis TaxID=342808 RepID=A0ABQ8UDE0_9EUKA|nr:putative WD and tetratricopeptide repeats protein 1 [Paratrimastix pyriformis]